MKPLAHQEGAPEEMIISVFIKSSLKFLMNEVPLYSVKQASTSILHSTFDRRFLTKIRNVKIYNLCHKRLQRLHLQRNVLCTLISKHHDRSYNVGVQTVIQAAMMILVTIPLAIVDLV